ncbi:MAG: Hsp20/alpha crystallin family protein [Proteobacteria bacterium]|nr:Hsp20/alpha crystallin family protein [Pseudomonadota bacterium]
MSEVNLKRMKTDERELPLFQAAERMMEAIQQRAYELASGRGFGAGRALDDWLAAERECGWPASELVERDQDYVLSVALPGVEPADIAVTATPRALYIEAHAKSGLREAAVEGKTTVHWSALAAAEFCRRLEFPRDIEVERVTATLRNGLLRITARKAERPAKPVRVPAAA